MKIVVAPLAGARIEIDETLEHIFSKERTREVPIKYQSIMVHVIEEVLGETGNAYEFQSVGTYEQADISDT